MDNMLPCYDVENPNNTVKLLNRVKGMPWYDMDKVSATGGTMLKVNKHSK